VGGYLGYSGRDANVVAKAARDPKPPRRDPLFDRLVCEGEQRWRHVDAEQPGGLQVDDELEPVVREKSGIP
jgi:hypothetical protein